MNPAGKDVFGLCEADVTLCEPCPPLGAAQIDLSVPFGNVFALRCPI